MCSSKETNLDAVIDIILEKLASGGTVTFTPHCTSMLPMLRDGKDVVVLSRPSGRLGLYDVSLYRRDNGQYVLHRVVDYGSAGTYVMCGDNQFKREKGIRDDQIIAVMTGFCRKGVTYTPASVRYRAYISFWYYTRFPRRCIRSLKRRFGITDKKKEKDKQTEDALQTK